MSGNTTTVIADRDVRVQGSNVVSSQGTQLSAGRDLSIEAATDTRHETHAYTEKQSGLFSGGGFGITIGTQQQRTDQDTRGGTAAASTIGSTAGDVLLRAGRAYTQTGSDVQTPQGNIAIVAPHVDIVAARETQRSQTDTHFTQSGLTLALSSPVITAIQTAVQMKDAASRTTDSRMQALAAANAGMAAYNAGTAIEQGQGSRINGQDNQIATGKTNPDKTPETRDATAADKAGGINLSLSLGGSRSQSRVVQNSNNGRGSTVVAGGNIAIAATGAGAASDLTVQGSTIKAGNDIRLAADNAIQLLAGKNTADQQSTNSSTSGALGVSVGNNGIGITLSASGARGKADGNDVTYANSHVEAGRQLILQSGGDTTLKGALAKAEQITAEVGGQLVIDSLQDTSTFKSRQQSLGGSATVGAGASASLSASQSKIDSDFASVAEQSGLKAGDGGFQVTVKGNTDLRGGAITSTDKAVRDGLNHFQTGGALTTSDIQNRADYRASSVGVNLGSSQANDGLFKPAGNSAGLGHDQGHSSSTTQAAISGIAGNLAARTSDAEAGIHKIFNADKVQQDINAQVLITQTFGAQASKAVGDYALTQTNTLKRQAEQSTAPAQKQALLDEAAKWEEGGTYRVLAHAAIGGLTGGAGGALGAGTAAYSAERINTLTNGMPEGVKQALGAAIASGIGAAVGGTAGAAAGFNEDLNNRQLHPDQITRIRQLNKNNSEREAQQLAVLCYIQNCNIAGTDGRLSGDAARLYQTGAQLLAADPLRFSQLQGEILADSALLKGNNSYGYLDKTTDLVGSTHYKGMGPTYQNVLVEPAKDYVSDVAESSKNTVVSSAKAVYQKAVVQNVPGLPGYEGAQADKAQSLLIQSRIEAGDPATINAGVSQIANATDRLLDGDPKAVGSVIGNTALLVTPVIVSRGVSLIAEIQEASAAAVAEAKVVAATRVELNLYRDSSLAGDMVQSRIAQLADRATHNPEANTVVLGKYVAGSANSYEQVAKANGATYFELPGTSWNEAATQLGTEKMWAINQQFLDTQIIQGKSFLFTSDPRGVSPASFTAKERNYLLSNDYSIKFINGEYRAIKN